MKKARNLLLQLLAAFTLFALLIAPGAQAAFRPKQRELGYENYLCILTAPKKVRFIKSGNVKKFYAAASVRRSIQKSIEKLRRSAPSGEASPKNAKYSKALQKLDKCLSGEIFGALFFVATPTPTATAEPTQTPTPTATPTSTPTALAITQYGITWYFDRFYPSGTFVNGDFWVAPTEPGGVVVITRISPDATKEQHGWEINPAQTNRQAFDRCDDLADAYDSTLMPDLPFSASAGMSIVKAVSLATPTQWRTSTDVAYGSPQCLETAAVLTVLDAPLLNSNEYFRPPYFGSAKPLLRADNLRIEKIPSIQLPSTVPSWNTNSLSTSASSLDSKLIGAISRIKRVQLDHLQYQGARLHPMNNLHFYGAGMSQDRTDVLLRIMSGGDSLSSKMPLVYALVQAGIDTYEIATVGENGTKGWVAAGGHGHGRLLPIAFAALMLDDQPMKSFLALSSRYRFGETSAIAQSSAGPDVGIFGEGTYYVPSERTHDLYLLQGITNESQHHEFMYWLDFAAHRDARTLRDPYGLIDGGEHPGGGAGVYQTCCSLGHWKGVAVALRLLQDGEALLSSTKNYFFNYVDRMRTHGALTQPDDCAPAVGKCANNPAISCTTANENERCEIGTSEEDNHEQRWCRPDGNGFCWNPITGIDQNAPCTLENEQTVCAAYEGKRCAITHIAGYGILFGPDGHGDCIKDTDPSDGIGRFPQMDTAGRGSGYHESWLTIAMENYYYGDSH